MLEDQFMEWLFAMIRQHIAAATAAGPSGGQGMSPELQAMILQLQTQMRQLDTLHRQQYEVRIGDLQGIAASAGLDWTPPS